MASFIENLRQWTSEQADKLTGQENIYHRSSGKTQKEYEQDLEFYKNLEDATRKSAVVLGALDGAVTGLGSTVGMPLWAQIGNAASGAWMGNFWPWYAAAVEKQIDKNKNGGRPLRRQLDNEEEY